MESLYRRHRFPPEIISHAVWLYHWFTLSFRDVEDLLAERCVTVPYKAVRSWCRKFGPVYARTLRRRQGRLGDIWHVDEVFITIRGKPSRRKALDEKNLFDGRIGCSQQVSLHARIGRRTWLSVNRVGS